MKALVTCFAICLMIFLVGCESTQSTESATTSPGAVSSGKACCGTCGGEKECGPGCEKPCCAAEADPNMGAVKEGACCGTCGGTCESKKANCCGTCGGEASPGAMGDSPCHEKKDCSGQPCPAGAV